MRERLLSFMLAVLVSIGTATAQTQISGGIVSEEDGGPLVGASIMVVGTKSGTVTDVNGRFVLNVKEGTELKISCLGMKPKIVKAKANLNIVLEPDENMLTDVVVTAMGISRQKKALGYAVSDLGGEEMVKARGGLNNPVNALQGKVAGLQISSGSGSMGGSSKILIRGVNSISGNNQPLFVIDGVPVEGTDFNSTETARGGGGYDYGNLVQDINPDDIENISVLKGAAASALYGSRANNGVIMITTKKGEKNAGLGVSFT